MPAWSVPDRLRPMIASILAPRRLGLATAGPADRPTARSDRTPRRRPSLSWRARSPLVAGEPLLLLPQQRRRRRALYEASRAGLRVPADALADTTAWLARPSGWDHNGGDGPFSDKRLARVAFTSALAAATRTGSNRDRAALRDAADPARARPGRRRLLDARRRGIARLAGGLRPRAGHVPGPREPGGGRPDRFRAAIGRADGWLTAPGARHGRRCLGRAHGHRGDGRSPASAARRREPRSTCSAAASPTTAAGGLMSPRPPSRSTRPWPCSAWPVAATRRTRSAA